jgi:hypothetical protein
MTAACDSVRDKDLGCLVATTRCLPKGGGPAAAAAAAAAVDIIFLLLALLMAT